jgi:hypothetical protein
MILELPLEILLEYTSVISIIGRGEFTEKLIDDSIGLPARLLPVLHNEIRDAEA